MPGLTSRRDTHPSPAPQAAASTLRCLHADVALTERTLRRELRRARARAVGGDQAWRERLQAYEQGDTLIVALTAHAVIDSDDQGAQASCCYCDEAVWIDRSTAPRALTDRLRALALRAFATVAGGLRDRGTRLSTDAEEITVALTIDPAVSAHLKSPARRAIPADSADPA